MRKRICNKYTSVAAILRVPIADVLRQTVTVRFFTLIVGRTRDDAWKIPSGAKAHSKNYQYARSNEHIQLCRNHSFGEPFAFHSHRSLFFCSPLSLLINVIIRVPRETNLPPRPTSLGSTVINLALRHDRERDGMLSATVHAEKDVQQVLVNGLFRTFLLFRRRLRQR